MRIIFMGTPEFAVPSLDILVKNGFNIVAVITATDKMGGRGGRQLLQSPVKKYAVDHGLPVLQPENLKAPAFIENLKAYEADLQVVVAFRMLPEVVWSMPSLGTFNLHGSLLPGYRGAAPINWAVINGEKETGVTTFFIQHEIDTGDILFQEKMPIGENETAGEVHDRMMLLGAEVVLRTVRAIETGNYSLSNQDDSIASKAPKIYHETCEIDFNQSVERVHDFVRGLSPFPGAWTVIRHRLIDLNGMDWEPQSWDKIIGEELKLLRTAKTDLIPRVEPGHFLTDGRKKLFVATKDRLLEILDLQLRGRKRMGATDFLNGLRSST